MTNFPRTLCLLMLCAFLGIALLSGCGGGSGGGGGSSSFAGGGGAPGQPTPTPPTQPTGGILLKLPFTSNKGYVNLKVNEIKVKQNREATRVVPLDLHHYEVNVYKYGTTVKLADTVTVQKPSDSSLATITIEKMPVEKVTVSVKGYYENGELLTDNEIEVVIIENATEEITLDPSPIKDWVVIWRGSTAKRADREISLQGVFFVDPNNGWIVGGARTITPLAYSGFILHTNDGGATWTEQNCGFSGELRDVYFIDLNNGWATGMEIRLVNSPNSGPQAWPVGSIFLRTSDGGVTWVRQVHHDNNIETAPPPFISYGKIQMIDDKHGWACGDMCVAYTDDGENWYATKGARSNPTIGPLVSISSMHFLDADKGYFLNTSGEVYFTSDGLRTDPVRRGGGLSGGGADIFFVDENVGWTVGQGNPGPGLTAKIWHTTDGGNNWAEQSNINFGQGPPGLMVGYEQVFFTDAQRGWIAGWFGLILHTIDGGNTWNIQSSDSQNQILGIFMIDENTGFTIDTLQQIMQYSHNAATQ